MTSVLLVHGDAWRAEYGEINGSPLFRFGYLGTQSWEYTQTTGWLSDLISVLTAVEPLAVKILTRSTYFQAHKLDNLHKVVVVEPRTDHGVPVRFFDLYSENLGDLISVLTTLQSAISSDDPSDWDGSDPPVVMAFDKYGNVLNALAEEYLALYLATHPADPAPDATGSVKGLVQLAGDLGGSASAPTVPGLAGKSDIGHKHPVTDLITTGTPDGSKFLRDDGSWQAPPGGGGGSVAWDDVTDKPSEFPPSAHTHTASQITDFSTAVPAAVPTATTSVAGKSELATNAETQTGTDSARVVTPAGLSSRTATETRTGIVELATSAETVTGTDPARAVTPAGVAATRGLYTGVNAQTGTTYTLVLTDQGKLVTCTNSSAITLTVPPNSSVAFPVGAQVDLAAMGTGMVTVTPGSGVTVNGTPSLVTRAQYSAVTLIKLATNTWLAVGDLADA